MTIIFAILLLELALICFMLIRNNWVYHVRISWIDNSAVFAEWNRAPSYNYMLLRFWRWSSNFEDWAAPKPIYLNDIRPSKSGQLERMKKGLQ